MAWVSGSPAPASKTITYTVHVGDSLWSIAGVDKQHDTRQVVDEIMRLNGMKDAAIWPGERLIVPVQ